MFSYFGLLSGIINKTKINKSIRDKSVIEVLLP